MALVPPTNLLEDQTVSSSFDQLLYVDDDSGLEETTLRVIASESTKSALQLCGEKVRIQSAETDLAAAFDVQTNGGTSIFTVDADTAATTTSVATPTYRMKLPTCSTSMSGSKKMAARLAM